ncbi:MAG: glycosyltransferase [Actinobacteria bacterium]|nr:MAG: glycosyltransferase [Actinomycetota bacterium]
MTTAKGGSAPSLRTVCWVVPAYDEAASIADLVHRIAEVSEGAGWRWRLIVVDDGSSDGTGDLARDAGAGRAEVLVNQPNLGLGRTIRRGLRAAAESLGPGDVIVTLDADLTQDPVYASALLALLDEGADVAIASRYRRGSSVEGLSVFRHVLSFGAGALMTLLRPIRGVRDYSCGFRAYRAEVVRDAFERWGDDFIREDGFGCMVEIAERLRETAVFAEAPFTLRYDLKRRGSAIPVLRTIAAYGRVLRRVSKEGHSAAPIGMLALAFVAVMLGAVGQAFLRAGAGGVDASGVVETLAIALRDPRVIGGFLAYGFSTVLWLVVLSRLDLSVAYPIGAWGYVVVTIAAVIAGEQVPPSRWAGVALIVLGILLVGWLGVAPQLERAKGASAR